MERYISLLGLVVMLFLAWLMSAHKTKINLRIILGGLGLQFAFALLVLKTQLGRATFAMIGGLFDTLLGYVDYGAEFVFGPVFREHYFAFKVLPTIVFFSSLMSMLYYLGVMQFIVKIVAVVMQKTLGTSGAESLSAAANIFVGQTEAPLVIKPYVAKMTKSELMAVMVGGFATIAGGVMAAFIGMGINATDLLTASILSAPAALVIAKIMQPEVEEPVTRGTVTFEVEKNGDNLIHAAANGAADGVKLALNVAGMLIAFIAIIYMFDGIIGWLGTMINPANRWSLQAALGYLFYPIAWLIGIPEADCPKMGELLGIRLFASEFQAYTELAKWIRPDSTVQLSERSLSLVTYALCGFSTFASIGIQIGGIGPLAPERTGDIAKLGLRAMLGGNLASFCTACVAGLLLTETDFKQRNLDLDKTNYTAVSENTQKSIAQNKFDLPKDPAAQQELINKMVQEVQAKERRLANDLTDESKQEIVKNREALRQELREKLGKLFADVPPGVPEQK